jgi:hypothetical protein
MASLYQGGVTMHRMCITGGKRRSAFFLGGWWGEHKGKKGIRTPVLNPHHVYLITFRANDTTMNATTNEINAADGLLIFFYQGNRSFVLIVVINVCIDYPIPVLFFCVDKMNISFYDTIAVPQLFPLILWNVVVLYPFI